jgi:hypothetical protein
MNSKKKDHVSPEEAYLFLPRPAKAIIQLLAVSVDYCRLDLVSLFYEDLQCTDAGGRRLTRAGLKPLINELMEQGLLVKNAVGLSCAEPLWRQAFHDTLIEDTYSAIVQYLQQYLSLPKILSGRAAPYSNYRQILRDFHIALFVNGSIQEVRYLAYSVAYSEFNDQFYAKNPFLTFLAQPFSAAIFKKINRAIRVEILTDLFYAAQTCLAPSDDILAYILENHGSEAVKKPLAPFLLFHHLLRGDTVSSRHLLDKMVDDDVQLEKAVWAGCLEFVWGNYPQSRDLFNKASQLLKKVSGKRKVFLQNYGGIFHLLTLLKSGEAGALREGLEYINHAEKNRYPVLRVITDLAPIFYEKLGLTVPERYAEGIVYLLKNPTDVLYSQLFRFWDGDKTTAADIALLRQTRDDALHSGYFWLAAEYSALLAALGQDRKTNSEAAAGLHASCATSSCVDIVRLQPPWEKTLHALLHLSALGKNKATVAEERLIWLFDFSEEHHFCHLSPRMQKMSVKGAWTKGRPVALKTLCQDHHDMPGLTDQDRRVCGTIKEEYFRSGWGRHTSAEYNLDLEKALPALVGHPLLFLENSPEVNVELVLAEPELHIRQEKDGLKLSVTPSLTKVNGGLMVQKDTPTRFKVIRFTAEHLQLINLLGKGMTIPSAGEELVRQAVEALTPLITVHSDLAGASRADVVPADCRPHAHILPYRDGISLEFLVKPIAGGSSSFRPGKGSKSVMAVIDGKSVQAVRDQSKERERLAGIIDACTTLQRLEENNNQWQIDDPEDSLELLLELKECGDGVIMEWPQGEKMAVRRQVSAKNFSLRIGKDRDWFKATGALAIDDTLSLELRPLLEMLGRSTGRFIPMDDGTFLALTRSLYSRLAELQAYSEGHGEGVRFAPVAALALEDLTRDAGLMQSDKAWKEQCRRLAETTMPPVPSTLQARLRDYQTTGFQWLARLSSWGVGACLADDMGLGKTVQALAAILLRAAQGPTLVVAPLSVTSNWLEEAGRFAPTLNVLVFGPGDRKQVLDNLQPFDLLVVSYGLLPLDGELLASVPWQTVVLDEAQAIKNMQTKRSRAAMGLRAECRIITTGTPVENHLGELWTLFNFLNPGLLGSFKKFNEKFALPIERDQDKEARQRLRKLIRPFILRRLKSDVLQELPAKTEITLEVEMSPEEQLLYEAQRQRAMATINAHQDEAAGPQHLRILAEIMKLRRLCCNPNLLLPEAKIASSKLRVFVDTLRELLENNHKALVFSQFVDHLGIIRDYLDKEKISYQYLDGSTPIKQRRERITDFQNGSGDVFLISLKAGGAGLNLTAADYVIHMDPWWNPAVEDQASDRAHRIGQDRPVTVYRLVMKDSIEQQIVNLHKQKRDLADSLLEGTDAAGKISATELLALLHDGKN